MKTFIPILVCLCSLVVHAQNSIDISNIEYPQIRTLSVGNPGPKGKEIFVNNLYMEISGVPQLPVMGEFHYARMNPEYWRDALLKMKSSGINIVSTYCLWLLHEEFEGKLSWDRYLNIRKFVELCDELGLKVHLRIGPYCNAEIRNGALPEWLVKNRNLKIRSNDSLYLEYVKQWYTSLYNQVKGLLYKDGGPIIAVQLENEYVKKGQIISHLTTLKKMAKDVGFDVPIYSMTHWMDSEYPKGEIIPYAGFYIEAPWTTQGKEEIKTTNFEYFTYNRLSDNIGTDLIKIDGKVESLQGDEIDSPFFTCEIGVGTTNFYHRRAVVPKEMAGEMINLRLGCGANLMGYYMYVGGSNPVGDSYTTEYATPCTSFDYQAPIREFGTMGAVMPEVKKYNYFMNDFGSEMAPLISYLPTSNKDKNNLQWAIRSDGYKGYLFCSNYLYKHERPDFKNVQFKIKLKEETLTIPRKKVDIHNEAYFMWPFNIKLGENILKYSTTQPICYLREASELTYFFFEDNKIPAEYYICKESVKDINVINGNLKKERNGYFIDGIKAGKDCVIEILNNNGRLVRIITLSELEADKIWKVNVKGKNYVALSEDFIINDNDDMILVSEKEEPSVELFTGSTFKKKVFTSKVQNIKADFKEILPFSQSKWVKVNKEGLERNFSLCTLAGIQNAYLRIKSSGSTSCVINGRNVGIQNKGEYNFAEVKSLLKIGENNIRIFSEANSSMIGELEVILTNGERVMLNTNSTWFNSISKKIAEIDNTLKLPEVRFAFDEHQSVYSVNIAYTKNPERETRMYVKYKGDYIKLYQNGKLVGDSFYDGTDWTFGIDRLSENAGTYPLIIKVKGLESIDYPVYFEKSVNLEECVLPKVESIRVTRENRYCIPLYY